MARGVIRIDPNKHRAFDPALEHVAPYFPDPYRPFVCPMGDGALRIDPNKQRILLLFGKGNSGSCAYYAMKQNSKELFIT